MSGAFSLAIRKQVLLSSMAGSTVICGFIGLAEAHEAAAAALAQLAYVQAREALACHPAASNAKPARSDHLDWEEFLARQAALLQVDVRTRHLSVDHNDPWTTIILNGILQQRFRLAIQSDTGIQ